MRQTHNFSQVGVIQLRTLPWNLLGGQSRQALRLGIPTWSWDPSWQVPSWATVNHPSYVASNSDMRKMAIYWTTCVYLCILIHHDPLNCSGWDFFLDLQCRVSYLSICFYSWTIFVLAKKGHRKIRAPPAVISGCEHQLRASCESKKVFCGHFIAEQFTCVLVMLSSACICIGLESCTGSGRYGIMHQPWYDVILHLLF